MLKSDIAGFSTLSQRMEANELVEFLNRYFGRMIDIVLDHGGNIDKFQGDGMLGVFGAPNPQEEHAGRAFEAAAPMGKAGSERNPALAGIGPPPRRSGSPLGRGGGGGRGVGAGT